MDYSALKVREKMLPMARGRGYMVNMRPKALTLLEHLTRDRIKKEVRLTDLLKEPEQDGSDDWFMHVPRCFNDALDIKQTPRIIDGKQVMAWTQGSSFSFSTGDVLYDAPVSAKEWAEALQIIRLCIQVKKAGSAETNPQGTRKKGTVEFEVLVPNMNRTRLVPGKVHAMSQDDFLRFLMTGEGVSL